MMKDLTATAAPTRSGTLLAETDRLEDSISVLESTLSSLEGALENVVVPVLPVDGEQTADSEALPPAVDYIRNLNTRVNRVRSRVNSILDRLQLS